MVDIKAALVREIEDYCRASGIAVTTFGKYVVRDGRLVARARTGSITIKTYERVLAFMRENPPANLPRPERAI